MRYYKVIKDDSVIEIGIGIDGQEITEEEHDTLKLNIIEKTNQQRHIIEQYVSDFHNKNILIEDIPTEYRDKVNSILLNVDIEQKLYTQEQYDAVVESLVKEGRL